MINVERLWKKEGLIVSNPLLDKLFTLDAEELSKLYKNIFDSEAGRLVLEDLRQRCFIYTTTAADTANKTYYNEGMRSVVLHIETEINYEPVKEKVGDNVQES